MLCALQVGDDLLPGRDGLAASLHDKRPVALLDTVEACPQPLFDAPVESPAEQLGGQRLPITVVELGLQFVKTVTQERFPLLAAEVEQGLLEL